MEVRTVGVWHNLKCPYSGTGLAVVVEKTEDSVHLFYPFTLEEWTMPIRTRLDDNGNVAVEGFADAVGEEYHNHEKIVAVIRERLRIHKEMEKSVPNPDTVSRVLAALEDVPLSKAQQEVSAGMSTDSEKTNLDVQKMTRKLRLKKHEKLVGRDAVVASVMKELKSATVSEIVEAALPQWTGRKKERDVVERHVVYTTNRWVELGWVEAI